HDVGEFFTPYLMTAGLVSAFSAAFLAVVMRRRKRAAWIFNLICAGPLLLIYVLAIVLVDGYRRHPFNWVSTGLTGVFVLALLIGRPEFQAKGDRSNPRMALAVLVGGGLVCGSLGTALVSVTDTRTGSGLGDRIGYTLERLVTLAPSASEAAAV